MRIALLLVAFSAGLSQAAPAPAVKYQTPPAGLVAVVDAPLTPDVTLDPTRQRVLLAEQPSLPPISELAAPELRLAGLRINPRTNGASRAPYHTRLTIQLLAGGARTPVAGLPSGAQVRDAAWSADGARLAFTVTLDTGVELWVADTAGGRARKLAGGVNDAFGTPPFAWLADGSGFIVRLIPEGRDAPPAAPETPDGPVIQENLGRMSPGRTYQDLLKNPHDETLFEYYFTSQVAAVSLDGQIRKLGTPGVLESSRPSPDGQSLLVQGLHRPYSYLVPCERFPRRTEIWDRNGAVIRRLADTPLAEEVPIAFSAVPTGPRSFGWRADAPATVYWVEAQDGGDPRNKAEVRDRVFTLAAPFRGKPNVLASLGLRYLGTQWGNGRLALVHESWWTTRKRRTWVVEPDSAGAAPRLLFDRSFEDRYSDPGMPVMRRDHRGQPVIETNAAGNAFYLTGEGASPEGDRPFLDRLDIPSGRAERLWRSEAPYYERFAAMIDSAAGRFLSNRETQSEPPNYFIRTIGQNEPARITDFPHPYPQLAKATKELIRYKRADGVELHAKLYLPPGYTAAQGPLPMLMWAYPREFKSASAAAQISDSPYHFPRVAPLSALVFLAAGYAVLEDATMPIIGEGGKEPNDTYIEQLVASAKAAVDEVVRRGVADPKRVAIGGHSYGAFMTANLLAHSDLFRAGIARSGAYNRTLTPFGFQSEERTLWQAPEIYARMSPFMHAGKVKAPILLIHGEADNNSGTFPIQSDRFYQALKGHGATVRFVLLPHESHGYRARESVLHMLWEMNAWLEKWVKSPAGGSAR